jgi:hypothetical protein
MNKTQFDAAVAIALDTSVRFIDDNGNHLEDISHFDGFGLESFTTVTCTIRQVAALIRWQAVGIFGGVDAKALAEIETIGRHKFNVVGYGNGTVQIREGETPLMVWVGPDGKETPIGVLFPEALPIAKRILA